jgi:hypothetical protein
MKICAVGLGVIAIAALASGCASTTGGVPKPFPMPDSAARAPRRDPASSGINSPLGRPPVALVDAYGVVGTALQLRGVPYRNGGSDPVGFDCSGFTQYVFAQHHIALPRDVQTQFQTGTAVRKLSDLAPGDLLFFSTTARGASHVGIAVGADEFVHAPSSSGVVRVEHLSAGYWSQRYLGARRVARP